MAKEIEIRIGNKPYRLQVEEGQEARVKHVAEKWNSYVSTLLNSAPNMERDRLLVLAGMMMADEFVTTSSEKEIHERTTDAFHHSLAERLEQIVEQNS